MAGRILSIRLLRSLQRHTLHSPSPLVPSPALLSYSLLTNLLSSRFFSGRRAPSNAGRKEKSLIEDEAELSDWIGDLKNRSLRLSLSSNSEDEPSRRGDRVTGKLNGRETFRGGDRNSKSSRGSVKKRGFYRDEEEDKEGDYSKEFSPRGRRGDHGVRSGRGKKDFDFDFSDEERGSRGRAFSSRRKDDRGRNELDFDFSDEERGSRVHALPSGRKDGRAGRTERLGGQRGQRGRRFDFGLPEKETWDESNEGFTPGKKGRGVSMSMRQRGGKASRGGRNLGFNNLSEEIESGSDEGFTSGKKGRGVNTSVRQRGGNAGQSGNRLDFDMSEDEIESDSDEGFSDFEEDFSQDKKDKMKEGLSGGDSGLGSEKSDKERDAISVRGSGGEHDSYLSQKR